MLIDVAQPSAGASTRWIADSGVLDLFLLLGPKPADVMAQYARLTGPTAMPQVRRYRSQAWGQFCYRCARSLSLDTT